MFVVIKKRWLKDKRQRNKKFKKSKASLKTKRDKDGQEPSIYPMTKNLKI